jgi:hypothetical protein
LAWVSQPEPYARSRTADRVVTVVEMVALAVLVPIASLFGLFFAMASDGCIGDVACSSTVITLGIAISAASPWVVWLVALVLVIRRWVRRRTTWWLPLVALAVGAALWALGALVAVSGVG